MIGGCSCFNADLGFFQEGRAGAALAALKKRLAPTALVRRDGEWIRLASGGTRAGRRHPAAARGLGPRRCAHRSGSVMVDQSMLTGESVPVDAEARQPGLCGFAGAPGPGDCRSDGDRRQDLFRPHGRACARRPCRQHRTGGHLWRRRAISPSSTARSPLCIVVYAYVSGPAAADLIRLALTALLATIPVALPATFTLSAAFSAQILAARAFC